jgi:hypothetical protein
MKTYSPVGTKESTSITTNERDNLPLRALDGPGLQIGVLCVGLQMLSNLHLSLSMAKDIPTNTLTKLECSRKVINGGLALLAHVSVGET